VSEVPLDHGDPVLAGQTVAVLRRPELDFEYSQVSGEIQTAEKRLAAVQAAKHEDRDLRTTTPHRPSQLVAQEEEIKQLLRNLDGQQQILKQQQANLKVVSPIQGQVITWNVKDLLMGRPVQRGQTLLTVADLKGPWLLELHIPENRVGHVLDATRLLGERLDVSFLLATDPGIRHRGKLVRMAHAAAQEDDTQRPTVLARVEFDRGEIAGLRPGVSVTAKVHCGRRSIGYVWFHDLLEAIESWIWF